MGRTLVALQAVSDARLLLWYDGGETRTLDLDDLESVLRDEGETTPLDARTFIAGSIIDEGEGLRWSGGLTVGADKLYGASLPVDLVGFETKRLVGTVAELRKGQGFSQAKVADAVGIKQPVVARLETGVNSPRLDTLLKILAPLGKTLEIVELGDIE